MHCMRMLSQFYQFAKVNLSVYELRDFLAWQKGLVIAGCMATSSRMRVHVLLMALHTADGHSGSY